MSETNTNQPKMYAFWRYDQPPYFLGSPVEQMVEDGKVRVEGYGRGVFRPVRLVLHKEGIILQQALNTLEADYRKEMKALHAKYMKSLEQIGFK